MNYVAILIGLSIWGLLALILLGWLVPLIVGIRRRRRGTGGKVLTGIAAAWLALVVGLVGMGVKTYYEWNTRYNHEVATFDPATYTGPVGTLTFPYAYTGTFEFRQPGSDGDKWWTVVVSNGTAVVPAGQLIADDLNFSVTDDKGKALGFLNCSFSSETETLTLATNGHYRMAGGLPLTASIKAESQGEKLSLNFSLVDAAGHKVAWNAAGASRKPPAFEAVAPSGNCFWRDNFEYG